MARPDVDISILGDAELQAGLRRLPVAAQKKVVRRAMRNTAKRMRAAILPNVPVLTGRLRKEIARSSIRAIRRSRNKLGATVALPTREAMGIKPDSKWYYPAILEYGSPKTGLKPIRYFRESVDASWPEERKILSEELRSGIESEWAVEAVRITAASHGRA